MNFSDSVAEVLALGKLQPSTVEEPQPLRLTRSFADAQYCGRTQGLKSSASSERPRCTVHVEKSLWTTRRFIQSLRGANVGQPYLF
eukprot:Skav220639  [mRNA]  locus=scaffold112:520383:523817:- [translate_table: standard]